MRVLPSSFNPLCLLVWDAADEVESYFQATGEGQALQLPQWNFEGGREDNGPAGSICHVCGLAEKARTEGAPI